MKLGCIVLAYHLPEQLARLVTALQHPQISVYLHIDRLKQLRPFTDALSNAGVRDVIWLRRHPSRWGSAECVDAALEGLAAGLADGCDYFVLISGQDFPIQPLGEIVSRFEASPDRSYIAHWPIGESRHRWHGRDRTDYYTFTVRGRRETCIPRGEDTSFLNRRGRLLNHALRARVAFMPRRHFPTYARPFQGSTWWNLSRPAAEYVFGFLDDHPDYRRYHQHTMIPEEVFFQSILAGTAFAEGHELVDDNLRFLRWDEGWHPMLLTRDDLPAMRESQKPFARKFDSSVDGKVFDLL